MACDKGSRINSALQTKQGSRGQVKQSRGFELAQPLGRPGSHLTLESPLMALHPLSTNGQTKSITGVLTVAIPLSIIEDTSNLRPQEETDLREKRKMLVPSLKQDCGSQDLLIPTSPRPPKSSFKVLLCRHQNKERWVQHLLLCVRGEGSKTFRGVPETTDCTRPYAQNTFSYACIYDSLTSK